MQFTHRIRGEGGGGKKQMITGFLESRTEQGTGEFQCETFRWQAFAGKDFCVVGA